MHFAPAGCLSFFGGLVVLACRVFFFFCLSTRLRWPKRRWKNKSGLVPHLEPAVCRENSPGATSRVFFITIWLRPSCCGNGLAVWSRNAPLC